MKRPVPQWLCFDLDGTLVDSVPDITFSLNEMLQAMRLSCIDETLARTWVGNGADKLIQRALLHVLSESPNEEQFESARQYFYTAYEKNIAVKTIVYPGCHEVLEYFFKHNIPMGCVTNKPRQFTPPLLERLNLANYFQAVVCGDDLQVKKPEPEPVLEAVRQLKGDVEKGYMVGDSETDILAARQAGAGAIYVSYGYNRGVCVEKHKPICVDGLNELLSLFG